MEIVYPYCSIKVVCVFAMLYVQIDEILTSGDKKFI